MLGHVAKKQRVDRVQDTPKDGYLHGIKVYLQKSTIFNAVARSNIWSRKITAAGGTVTQDAESATHVVIGEKHEALETSSLPKKARVVTSEWLEDCLSKQRRLPEREYAADPEELAKEADRQLHLGGRPSPLRKYERWLGHWKPEYDAFTRETEVVLQAEFSEHHEAEVGNEAIVKGLVEMRKYWDALEGDFRVEETGAEGFEDEKKGRTHHMPNHGSLSFARAASVMRACAFKIQPGTDPATLHLPFAGRARAAQICDLATTGTTAELEEHRSDTQVYSSVQKSGQRLPYEGAVGSATRRMFKKLPGAGARTAKLWWDLGFRSFEDIEEAAKPGGICAQGGRHSLSVSQAFSLRHRADLLEDLTAADVQEMREVVLDVLGSMAGEGWTMDICGGAARGLPSHDADFVVSHPTKPTLGVVDGLVKELIARGKLFPKEEAMCQTSDHRMPDHLESMRQEVMQTEKASFFKLHNLSGDRHDHFFGNFRTAAGKIRRIDVIIAPAEEQAFCVLGWTGSRQYLRFLRQHVVDLGMNLNSHRLMRRDEKGKAVLVPDEAPPVDRTGKPYWPPGWSRERRVTHESHIFELCGIPYMPPHLRNAP